MLGAQVRLVFLLEWLTRLPDIMPLLQTSQNLAILYTSLPTVSVAFRSNIAIIAERICICNNKIAEFERKAAPYPKAARLRVCAKCFMIKAAKKERSL